MVWPLIAAGASAASSYFGQQAGNKALAKRQSKIDDYFNYLFSEYPSYAGAALDQRKRALKDVQAGYGQGIKATVNAGTAAERSARDINAASMGASTQDMLSRGLFNPQQINAARRGHSYELSRVIGEIGARTASMVAPMYAGRGEATANARGGIANQYMQNFGVLSGLQGARADAAQAEPPPYANDYSGEIGALLGALSTYYGGKPGEAQPTATGTPATRYTKAPSKSYPSAATNTGSSFDLPSLLNWFYGGKSGKTYKTPAGKKLASKKGKTYYFGDDGGA